MGYSADMISNDADIVLRVERLPAVIEALYAAQGVLGTHISWCNPLDDYDQSDPAAFVAEVFSDYGFDTHVDADGVVLYSWGGDKIGSAFDPMMEAIAAGVGQSIETVWQGEDGSVWAVRFDGQGGVRQAEGVVSFDWGD